MPVTTFKNEQELAAACRDGFRPIHVTKKSDGSLEVAGYWEV